MTTKRELINDRRNVLMREALKQEINDLAKKSVQLKKSMESATSEYKRERLMTKLRRNNNKIFELVEALEKIPKDVKYQVPTVLDNPPEPPSEEEKKEAMSKLFIHCSMK